MGAMAALAQSVPAASLGAPYPLGRLARCTNVSRPAVSLPRRLELIATARWSWSTYRHLGRPRATPRRREARRAA
jgi:hypothetical protein